MLQYEKDCDNVDVSVFLCYDKDVFIGTKNPPVDWKKVEKELKRYKANHIYHIIADQAIEDFILLDYENVLRFLRLGKGTKNL